MAWKDRYNNDKVVDLLMPTVVSADTKTGIFDVQDVVDASIVVSVGCCDGHGANRITPILQESATTADVGFTAVAAADRLGAFVDIVGGTVGATDRRSHKVGYIGNQRFIRVLLDETGTVVVPISVIGLGTPRSAPAPTTSVAGVACT